jgi:Sugar phosphate isomerases/epimerases
MIITMHGFVTMYSNLKTDIRIASETGYEALEILASKLIRYLDLGFEMDELDSLFKKYSIKPVCINCLLNIERVHPKEHEELLSEAERLCKAASIIGCPTIQLVALCGLESKSWPEILKHTSKNITEIADIGKNYKVRFQLEPIAWSPINSLSKSLEVLDKVNRDNVGLVIDFWHLYAGEKSNPEEVSKLDSSLIYGVHFCDGIKHKEGTKWVEGDLRQYLPGEGEVQIKDWVKAVKSTGFDGVYSAELLSPKHWEWDHLEIAREAKKRMEDYIL